MSNSGGNSGGGGALSDLFRVTVTNAFTTLADAQHTLIWDTVDYDLAAGYSLVTGLYTIPASGKYFFSWLVNVADNTSTSAVQSWLISSTGGRLRAGAESPADAFLSNYASSGSAQYNATAGDQIGIAYQCHESGKSFTDGDTGHHVSEFAGFRVA